MQKAKAFVYAAVEDFGIVPVEAMACGTPVIALNRGGTAETVIGGVNGIYFENQTKEDIIKAVNKFEKVKFNIRKVRYTTLKYKYFKHNFKMFVEQFIK